MHAVAQHLPLSLLLGGYFLHGDFLLITLRGLGVLLGGFDDGGGLGGAFGGGDLLGCGGGRLLGCNARGLQN